MSAALRRRRLPVRIRPGTPSTGARSSIRRAPLSHSGGQGCNSPRVHTFASQAEKALRPVGNRRVSAGGLCPPELVAGGVEPSEGSRSIFRWVRVPRLAPAPTPDWTGTRVLSETMRVRIPPEPRRWRRSVGDFLARPRAEPTVDGYLGKTFGSTGVRAPRSPPSLGA